MAKLEKDRAGAVSIALSLLLLASITSAKADVTEVFAFPAGENPFSGVVQAANGNFFGATPKGGSNNAGTIFQITPGGELVWSISLNSKIGSTPYGPLLEGLDGWLYGTASAGGARGRGSIFKVSPAGVVSNLYSFNGGSDGATPYGGLIQSDNGNFFGTTSAGGASSVGTVFQISPAGAFTNLHTFDITNGANPYSGVTLGANGDLYGVTQYGGIYGEGTLFQIGASNVFTVLADFRGDNGANPKGLIQAQDGNFYGVTLAGGPNGLGTLFKFTPSNKSLSTVAVFTGVNGANPNAPLFQAANGDLLGTAQLGGADGVGTVFKFAHSTLSTVTSFVLPQTGGFPNCSLIQAMDGNIYGTTSSGGSLGNGNIFRIGEIAPVIVVAPTSITNRMGTNVVFSAVAIGSEPLQFQWRKGSENLVDGGNILGSTTDQLTISNISSSDAGSYTLIVSNSTGSAKATASLTVLVDANVAIVSPAVNTRGTNFVVTGTASDSIHPFTVFGWFTNLNDGTVSDPIPLGTDSTNWIFTPALPPGTNIVFVQTRNDLGNNSLVVSRSFFSVGRSPFSLGTNGNGSIIASSLVRGEPPATNMAALAIGQAYQLQARPGRNFVFTNWSGSISSTSPTLTFVMQPGMSLTANFVTNGFIPMAGTYAGLVMETNGARVESSGRLTGFRINPNGTYSGRLVLNGAPYTVSGSLDISGAATQQIKRPQGDLTLLLQLNLGSSPRFLAGTLLASNWTARLNAWATAPSSSFAASTATMLISPASNSGAAPVGFGYATVAGRSGILNFAGKLADGTPLSDSPSVLENGMVPVYASLYRNSGVLVGWLDVPSGVPSGELSWINNSTNSGFGAVVPVTGSPWVRPAKGPAVAETNLVLVISGGGLSEPLVNSVAIQANNRIVKQDASTNSVSGFINPGNGVVTLTFGTGAGKTTVTGYGAFLQDQSNAGGAFVRGTNFGSFTLEPLQ